MAINYKTKEDMERELDLFNKDIMPKPKKVRLFKVWVVV
jgi:hypothetical protein